MSVSDVITLIASIVSVVGAGLAIIIAYRKAPAEVHSLESSADASQAEAVRNFAEASGAAAKEIVDLRKDVAELKMKICELESRNACYERQLSDWQRGIEMLIGQIVSLGQKPVWQPKAQGMKNE